MNLNDLWYLGPALAGLFLGHTIVTVIRAERNSRARDRNPIYSLAIDAVNSEEIAWKLMLDHLSPFEQDQLFKTGNLYVTGYSGMVYALNHHGPVWDMSGRYYCVYPADHHKISLPRGDCILALKILLETRGGEDYVRRKAAWTDEHRSQSPFGDHYQLNRVR